jgi:ankyrin repeat protein
VNALIAAGANVNDDDDQGETPLMIASRFGSLGAVTALIAAGADVNCVSNGIKGATAIRYALARMNTDIISALITAGADVNCIYCNTRNNEKWTILDRAVSDCSRDIFDMLVKAGAKHAFELMEDVSDLIRAVSCGDGELANKLVEGAGDEEKDMALTLAVAYNQPLIVKFLLATGANPDTTRRKKSVLIVACRQGYTAVVKELIDAGADITATFNGVTAMKYAAKKKHRDIVALLLAKASELKKAENK